MIKFNINWYNKFIQSTNEKKLLVHKISDILIGKPHNSCLEIGLGTSPYFAQQLAKNFSKYVIVERQLTNAQLPSNVTLINNDWEKVDLDEKYDIIIASHVVYYFKDKKSAIDKILTTFNEGGRAIFVVNGKKADYGPLKLAFSKMIGSPYIFTYEVLLKILQNKEINEYTLPSEIRFSSFDELFNVLYLLFDNYPAEYQKFKGDIINYLQQHITNNKFIIEQKIIEVRK